MPGSRDQILRKAVFRFLIAGYEGCSLNDLCASTGLTKGALYHHFKNKREIYHAAAKEFFGWLGLPQWLEKEYTSLEDLIRSAFLAIDQSVEWIKRVTRIHSDKAILHFYSFLYEATRMFPEFQARIDELDKKKHDRLEYLFTHFQKIGQLRKELNCRLLALELDALTQQIQYLRFVNPWIKSDARILERLAENYLLRLKG